MQGLSENEIRAKQREIFANIPEFYVKDMCSWFSFATVHKPYALKGLDVSVILCIFLTFSHTPVGEGERGGRGGGGVAIWVSLG